MDIYRDAKRRSIYLALDTDPEEGIVVTVFTKIMGSKCTFLSKKQYARAFLVILSFASKPTNSLGNRELREPIRARENGYWLLW